MEHRADTVPTACDRLERPFFLSSPQQTVYYTAPVVPPHAGISSGHELRAVAEGWGCAFLGKYGVRLCVGVFLPVGLGGDLGYKDKTSQQDLYVDVARG